MSFVICLSNSGYPASLEARKVYQAIADKEAEREGMLRVIDESGEDYLFPRSHFAMISLPRRVKATFSGPKRRKRVARVATSRRVSTR